MFGEEHGFFSGAADADTEHAGWAPACAHGGDGFEHPFDNGIGGGEHHEFAFGFGASTFGHDGDLDLVAFDEFDVYDGWGVVFGVFAGSGGVSKQRGAELVDGIEVGAANTFVCHFLDIEGLRARRTFKSNIHTHLDEDVDDAGVLADGTMSLGAHAAVDEDLRDGVLGGVGLLALVGLGEVGDVVGGVVVTDVLQRTSDAGNKVFLADSGHERAPRTL